MWHRLHLMWHHLQCLEFAKAWSCVVAQANMQIDTMLAILTLLVQFLNGPMHVYSIQQTGRHTWLKKYLTG